MNLAPLLVLQLVQLQPPTYSPLGSTIERSYLERHIKGISIYSVTACGPKGVPLSTGASELIGIAGQHSPAIILFPAAAVDAVTNFAVNRSLGQYAADIGEGVGLGAAAVTSSGIVSDSHRKWTIIGVLAAGFFHWLSGKLQRFAPDPSRLKSLTLPEKIELPQGGCFTGLSIGRSPK